MVFSMKVSKLKNNYSLLKLSILFCISFSFFGNSQTFDVTNNINTALARSPLLLKQENNNKIIELDLKQFNTFFVFN